MYNVALYCGLLTLYERKCIILYTKLINANAPMNKGVAKVVIE